MTKCGAEILVSGIVQGVGFRHYCTKVAKELLLNGWVTNDKVGTVSIFVEGTREIIEQLIEKLKLGPSGANVNEVQTTWLEYTDSCKRFEIKF